MAASDYVDVQISLDGATAEVNDAVRGPGSYDTAITALQNLADAGFKRREDLGRADPPEHRPARRVQGASPTSTAPPCDSPGCARRAVAPTCGTSCTRLPEQQRELYDWLVAHGEGVLTGDSFFHLAAFGEALPGLNLCGAGRVVCLIDPVGDVYACPFAIHDNFLAGNIVADGGFAAVWPNSALFAELREPSTVAHARRARTTTPAAVAAWPRSSSPVSRQRT